MTRCVRVSTYDYLSEVDFHKDTAFLKNKYKHYTYSTIGDLATFWGVPESITEDDLPNSRFKIREQDPYKWIGYGLTEQIIKDKGL